MPNILQIKDVPRSPGTGLDVTEVTNPLDEDFTWSQDGKPYTIPANGKASFPEFLARHLAKHLARKIVYANAYKEIEEAAKGQLTPDSAKAVPVSRAEIMEAWLLQPKGKSPEEGKGEATGKEPSTDPKLDEKSEKVDPMAKARSVKAAKKKAADAVKAGEEDAPPSGEAEKPAEDAPSKDGEGNAAPSGDSEPKE